MQVNFELTVEFSADVYGTYRQRLALVFPHHAPMLCWLQASVTPLSVDQLVEELRGKLTISEQGWTDDDAEASRTRGMFGDRGRFVLRGCL